MRRGSHRRALLRALWGAVVVVAVAIAAVTVPADAVPADAAPAVAPSSGAQPGAETSPRPAAGSNPVSNISTGANAAPAAPGAGPTAGGPTQPPPGSVPAPVQQPRPFGYVLGDTLTQWILLQWQGHEFEAAQLPSAERAGLWLSRRSVTTTRDETGRNWLVLDYQIINAPQQLMTVNLPAITLKSKTGSASLFVPEWPISIAPLTPRIAFAKGGLQDLRPDHPAPALPTATLWRQLEIWITALVLTAIAWFGWWLIRYIRAAANQPFARALRDIRRSGGDGQEAWLALHRAFDRTAGRALQINTLEALFQRAPYFESRRAEIERFYVESTWRFFGAGTGTAAGAGTAAGTGKAAGTGAGAGASPGARTSATAPNTAPAAAPNAGTSLQTLCATLRRIEKQHER